MFLCDKIMIISVYWTNVISCMFLTVKALLPKLWIKLWSHYTIVNYRIFGRLSVWQHLAAAISLSFWSQKWPYLDKRVELQGNNFQKPHQRTESCKCHVEKYLTELDISCEYFSALVIATFWNTKLCKIKSSVSYLAILTQCTIQSLNYFSCLNLRMIWNHCEEKNE